MSSDYGLGGSVVRKRADSLQLKPKVCYSQLRVFHKSLNVAGETRSDARVASEAPRATVSGGFLVEKRPPSLPRRARACPPSCSGLPETRGGQAPALRYCDSPPVLHRDQQGSPTGEASIYETPSVN